MLERTHIPEAPRWVVEANDKKRLDRDFAADLDHLM
jgi:polyphosphate kinase 2 (PPK2 family)